MRTEFLAIIRDKNTLSVSIYLIQVNYVHPDSKTKRLNITQREFFQTQLFGLLSV